MPRRGTEVGDADASTYFGAHFLALHWYRGTAVELLDVAEELSASTAMAAESRIFSAVVAALAAESGDVDRAQRALALVGRGRLATIPPDSTWMSTMFALVEAAVALDDAALAEEVYALLLPFRDLPMLGSLAVCCLGPTERALGLAARVAGRGDDAVVHLERAVERVQALGNRPVTAITRAELAETLLARDAPGDRDRAALLLTQAVDEGERLELDTRVRRWSHLRELAAGPAEPVVARCERDALRWELTTDCERATVRHTVGMEYLAALLAAPRTEIAAACARRCPHHVGRAGDLRFERPRRPPPADGAAPGRTRPGHGRRARRRGAGVAARARRHRGGRRAQPRGRVAAPVCSTTPPSAPARRCRRRSGGRSPTSGGTRRASRAPSKRPSTPGTGAATSPGPGHPSAGWSALG